MNKQDYADKWSSNEWQKLCKSDDFVSAFWWNDFEHADKIANELLRM